MSLLDAFILGVIQAITEFLPVSSSGHLVLAQHFFGIQQGGNASYEIIVHLGTLVSVCFYFRHRIIALLKGFVTREAEWVAQMRFLILGTLPAGIVGLTFKDEIESFFNDPKMVACCLLLTGLIVLLTSLAQRKQEDHPQTVSELRPFSGLWVGIAQAIAILPGISRSGSTIAMAVFLNIPKKIAAELSFLLSIPVIAGAGLLKGKEILSGHQSIDWSSISVAFFSAMILGYLVLDFMLKWLQKPSFSILGIYCIIISLISLFYLN